MRKSANAAFEIERTKKKRKFTIVDNSLLLDTRLTARARLIMAIVISLPDNWDFNVVGISKISGESYNAVCGALTELVRFGYLEKNRLRDESGRHGQAVYRFYEAPRAVEEIVEIVEVAEVARPAPEPARPKPKPKPVPSRARNYDYSDKGFGKKGRKKSQNYEGRAWDYDHLMMLEQARLLALAGREEEAEGLRARAREVRN